MRDNGLGALVLFPQVRGVCMFIRHRQRRKICDTRNCLKPEQFLTTICRASVRPLMRTLYCLGLPLLLLQFATVEAPAQQSVPSSSITTPSANFVTLPGPIVVVTVSLPAPSQPTITLSGTATNAKTADPNERVLFSGRVMRMSEFVAAVSSSNAGTLRPHTPETHSRETDPLAPQSPPKD